MLLEVFVLKNYNICNICIYIIKIFYDLRAHVSCIIYYLKYKP